LEEAKARIHALREELDADPGALSRRECAARARAARERKDRVEQALSSAKALQEKAKKHKNKKDPEKVRVSTTDPEAKVMKMADGGFRPAVNIQFATDTESPIIVGVDATSQSDAEQLVPMHAQLLQRYGRLPEQTLADSMYASRSAVTTLARQGVTVIAPVRKPTKPEEHSPYERRWGDTDEYAQFRKHMETDEAKTLYKQRAATAELINAHVSNRGLDRVRVRGTIKAKAIALLHALAQNLTRAQTLRGRLAEVTI